MTLTTSWDAVSSEKEKAEEIESGGREKVN
jgi:hypothetical protein